MKKYIFFIMAALLAVTGCEKVLEVEPVNYITDDRAIEDKTDVERALVGCYSGLQQTGCYGRHLPIIGDITADNLNWTGTTQDYGQFQNNSLLADNGIVESIWNAHYDVINRVNWVIYKLPGIEDISQQERDDFYGQLYFIRALCHFNLVRYFGAVPIKTLPTLDLETNLDVPRDNVDAVYARIRSDLESARGKLLSSNPGYVTNGAVAALMADVCLYMGDYGQANIMANEVIGEYGYALADDFASLYSSIGNEAIFVILFNPQDNNRLAEYYFPTIQGGRYEVSPSQDLISDFDTTDARLSASITGDPPYGIKYPDLSGGANNVYVFRLAEMHLIRAEAEARLNGSVSSIQYDINLLRIRANIGDVTSTDYDELLGIIEQERRRELALEGKRWFDLVRMGKAIEELATVTNENQLLFPIPAAEIQSNSNPGMYQNPGY
jgi:hypothetical protein